MSLSNYPPGVTGREPQITGEGTVYDDPHHPWYAYLSAEGNVCLTNNFVNGPSINIPMASWERANLAVEIMNRGVAKHRYTMSPDASDLPLYCTLCQEIHPAYCGSCGRKEDDHVTREDTYGRDYLACPPDEEDARADYYGTQFS
jgi:hypothetical protein